MNKVEIHASILMKERGRETKRHRDREKTWGCSSVEGKILCVEGMMAFNNQQVLTLIRKKLNKESLLPKPPTKYFFNHKENNANFTVEKLDRKLFNQVINVTSP